MKRATDFMTENSKDDMGSAKAADTEIDLSSPGARLKAERERQGFEEEELATKLHITRHYLRAIEENAYDTLPGVVFARGYVRNYCVLLEMPTEPLMTMFEALVETARKEKEAEGVPKRKLTRVDRNQRWLSLSLLVFVSLFGVLWFLNG
jgi:cytoskeleton protein RodZ